MPVLSGCLTTAAVLVAIDQAESDRRAREDYHAPAFELFARDGVYDFDGPFGRARVSIERGRATVHLSDCARFSGTLGPGSFTYDYEQFLWDLDEPRPPWSSIWALTPENLQILEKHCDGLGQATTIQMTTAYRGPDRGGYGSALFVQGLGPVVESSIPLKRDQVFAKAFGAP